MVSATPKKLCFLWEPDVNYFIHNSLTLDPILSQLYPIDKLTTYLFKIHYQFVFVRMFHSPKQNIFKCYILMSTYFWLLIIIIYHTVHSPIDSHLLKLWLQFTLKLAGSYMFRSTTIIRELVIEPGWSYIDMKTLVRLCR